MFCCNVNQVDITILNYCDNVRVLHLREAQIRLKADVRRCVDEVKRLVGDNQLKDAKVSPSKTGSSTSGTLLYAFRLPLLVSVQKARSIINFLHGK